MDQDNINKENSRILIKLKAIKSVYKVNDWAKQRKKEETWLDTLWYYPHQFKWDKLKRTMLIRDKAFNSVIRERNNEDLNGLEESDNKKDNKLNTLNWSFTPKETIKYRTTKNYDSLVSILANKDFKNFKLWSPFPENE